MRETVPDAVPTSVPDDQSTTEPALSGDPSGSDDGVIGADPFGGPDGNGDPDGRGDGRNGQGSGDEVVEGPPPSEPVRIRSDIQPPVLVERVEPEYPAIARNNGIQGQVALECVIDERGRVEVRRVLKGKPMLEAAAREAVEQWRYEPALLDGRPQAVFLVVRVDFSLGR